MAKHQLRHSLLSDTAPFDNKSGELRAVIETPKGSRSISHRLLFHPFYTGWDGDPQDVLVLMDAAVIADCLLRCRAIGVIEA